MCLQGPITSEACCIEPQPLPTVSSVCLVTLGLQLYWRWFNTLGLIRKQHILKNKPLFCFLSPPVHFSLTLSKKNFETPHALSSYPPSVCFLLSLFSVLFFSSFAVNWTPSSMMPQCWTTWPAEMRGVSWWPLAAGNLSFSSLKRHFYRGLSSLHGLILPLFGPNHSVKLCKRFLLCLFMVVIHRYM